MARPAGDPPRRGGARPPPGSRPGRAGAPRRGVSSHPRRGSGQAEPEGPDGKERGFGGISDARAYTPRGRTVRERGPRDGRGDPFRPALQVVEGGQPRTAARRRTAGNAAPAPEKTGAAGAGRSQDTAPREARTSSLRGGRGGAAGVPEPRRRTAAAKAAAAAKRSTAPRRKPGPRRPPQPPRLADQRRRLRLGTVLALTLFTTIGIRLVTLQFTDSPAFEAKALSGRLASIDLPAPRGAIYDRNGAVLAHSVEGRFVAVDPELVKDLPKTAAALSPLLGISQSELAEKMRKRTRPGGGASNFEYLARGVDVATAQRVEALNLPEIIIERDERREVPGADLAANLLGFTSHDLNGLEGLEARYDDLLRGVNGRRVYEVGQGSLAAEIPGGYRKETPAQPGSSLQLTIDRDLQYRVQQILSENMQRAKATTAAAVVMDIRTGEVLAQASHPTYNVTQWNKSKPADREDAATSFVVDPGSVHKAITIGAALEEGLITPDSTILVPPVIRKGDQNFDDTHPPPGYKTTPMTIPGILAYSSNVGSIKIGDKLGPEKLYEYQQKFGLGAPTGEGVPGEAAGKLLAPEDWSGSSYGSVPIGHSVAVTPLQMAAAYATIANDGTWVQPHIVKETIAPDGVRTRSAAPKTRPVLSPETAKQLRLMMEAVVTVPGATGKYAAVQGYRVAGKSGTGSRVVNGEYVEGPVASFVGMAPVENPRYVIAVFAHTPAGGGGEVTAPSFSQMMAYTLTHYRVPPSTTEPPKFTVWR